MMTARDPKVIRALQIVMKYDRKVEPLSAPATSVPNAELMAGLVNPPVAVLFPSASIWANTLTGDNKMEKID